MSLCLLVVGCSSNGDNSKQDLDGNGIQFTDANRHDAANDLAPDLADLASEAPPDLPPDLRPDVPPDLSPDTCEPSCAGRQCGDDNCGGICGTCNGGQQCIASMCVDKVVEVNVVGTPELVWDYSATKYCAFPDAPLRMYRDAIGRAVALISQVNAYRLESNTTDGSFSVPTAVVPVQSFSSPQNKLESAYDSLMWIHALWTDDGKVIHALAHHEWYQFSLYQVGQGCIINSSAPNAQVNGIHHLTSVNSGALFTPTYNYIPGSSTNNERMAVAPELWGSLPVYPQSQVRYGVGRPSNIAKEGAHYYVVAGFEELARTLPAGSELLPSREGFVMLRTTDISGGWSNGKWEIWDGSAWAPIGGPINRSAAHIFTHSAAHPGPKTLVNFTDTQLESRIDRMSFSLTRTTVANRWLLIGHTANKQLLAYTSTASLSHPKWAGIRAVGGSDTLTFSGKIHPKDSGGQPDWSEGFPSLIDHGSAGKVYMYSGANPTLYYARTVAGVDRDIFRVALSVTVK